MLTVNLASRFRSAYPLLLTPTHNPSCRNRMVGLAAAIAWLVTASSAFSQATGGVQGAVKDDVGQPLAGVNVVLTTTDHNLQPAIGTTDSSGNFSVTGLKPGNYTICLNDAANKHLDPCSWSAGTKVVVKPNQNVTDNLVTGVAAATLQVRVDDPSKLLDPKSGAGVPMVAVILSNDTLAPMNLVQSDDGGKTFQIAVPPGSHKLFIRSNVYKIADGRGEDLDGPVRADGKVAVNFVDAPVSVKSGMSYVAVTITGKR